MREKKMTQRFFAVMVLALLCALAAGAAPPVAAQGLRQTEFEDGTGSIGLPPGWHITQAYRGTVACIGPNGEGVVLGYSWYVVPAGEVLPGAGNQPIARPGDIVGAVREVLFKKFGSRLTGLQGRPAASAVQGAPAAHLLYSFVNANGRSYTGFGYFSSIYHGPGTSTIQLYSSYVVAPSEQFNQTVQLMVSIWRSWRPNGQEPREGSTSAMWDRILRERQINFDFWTRLMREEL